MKSGFKEVYDYYLSKSQELVNRFINTLVLKTDCYNEAEIHPLNHSIAKKLKNFRYMHLIDCNSDFIKLADNKLGDRNDVVIFNGDIRCLPYKPESFDVLLDLSTVDHIPMKDLSVLFKGYKRVLKEDGVCLIVSWVSNTNGVEKKTWLPTNQYYHFVDDFERELNTNFVVVSKEELILEPNNDEHVLIAYEVKK